MIGFSQRHTFVKSILLAIALLGTSVIAQAQQQLGVTGNSITVSNAGGGLAATAVPISSAGVVTTVTGIPTSGPLDLPTFTFTMNTNGVTNGVYTFAVGFIIDENGASSRRLELNLPLVTMTFTNSGNTLVGNATTQTVRAIGRDFGGGITAAANLNVTGTLAFSGNSLAFNADNALADIAGGVSPLNDIISTIDTLGTTYTYKFILHQLSGPATLNFGTDPAAFTAYPAYAGDFILNANELSLQYAAGLTARKLTGQLSFAAAAAGGGSSTGTPQDQAETSINTATASTNSLVLLASGTVNAGTVTTLSELVNTTTATVTSVATGLANGTVTPAAGIDLVKTLAAQMGISQTIVGKSVEVPASTVTSIIKNIASVIGALRGKTISASEILLLRTQLTSTITDTAALLSSLRGKFGFLSDDPLVSFSAITAETSIADITSIVNEMEVAINNSLEIPGVLVTNAVYTNLQNLSQTALELLLAPIGTRQGLSVTYSNNTSTQALLSANPTLMSNLLDAVSVNVGTSTEVDKTATAAAFVVETLSGTAATAITNDVAQFVKADSLLIDIGAGAKTVSSTLTTALGADTLVVDAVTGAITYTKGSSSFVVALKAVAPAPAALPIGQFNLPDGSTAVVASGFMYILVPASNSLLNFAGAIQTAGSGTFTTSVTDSGVVKLLETASNVVFSSTISNKALESVTATSATTFGAATGDPASATYLFTVQYADGSRQEILPAIADPRFYQSVANAGFQISTDRSTGNVQIASFNFRPDFFLRTLTVAESLFLASNDDTSGVAYRAVDANGDGVTDYEILSPAGVQVVYGQP